MYISSNIVRKLDKMFFNFLWSNRKHGISKKVVIQPIEFAGIKIVCIESMIKSFKILWFKRLLNNVDAKGKHFSWYLLGVSKKQLFSKLSPVNGYKMKFYKQILEI